MGKQQIVAEGRKRLLRSKESRGHREQVIAEVVSRYEPRLQAAGRLKRLRLRWQMRREIRRQLDQLAPKRGCYLISGGG